MRYQKGVSMVDVMKILDRVKALQEFEVTAEVPNEFRLYGAVPFDFKIENKVMTAKILAASLDEAMYRMDCFLFGISE